MADPRAFISFDFDHNETGEKSIRRPSKEFKDPVLNSGLVGQIGNAPVTVGIYS